MRELVHLLQENPFLSIFLKVDVSHRDLGEYKHRLRS